MYRMSKYTFICENKNKELLFYNTLQGVDSFCKLPFGAYDEAVLETHSIDNIDSKYYSQLRPSRFRADLRVASCKLSG